MRNKGLSKLKSAIYPLLALSVGTNFPSPTTKFQSEKWCKIKKEGVMCVIGEYVAAAYRDIFQ